VGVGIGPLRGSLGRALVGLLLRLAHAVLVRDEGSARLCNRLAPRQHPIEGLDLALLRSPGGSAARPLQPEPLTLGLSVIPYFTEFERDRASDMRMLDALTEAAAAIAQEAPLRVVLLPFFDPPREPRRSDYVLSENLAEELR